MPRRADARTSSASKFSAASWWSKTIFRAVASSETVRKAETAVAVEKRSTLSPDAEAQPGAAASTAAATRRVDARHAQPRGAPSSKSVANKSWTAWCSRALAAAKWPSRENSAWNASASRRADGGRSLAAAHAAAADASAALAVELFHHALDPRCCARRGRAPLVAFVRRHAQRRRVQTLHSATDTASSRRSVRSGSRFLPLMASTCVRAVAIACVAAASQSLGVLICVPAKPKLRRARRVTARRIIRHHTLPNGSVMHHEDDRMVEVYKIPSSGSHASGCAALHTPKSRGRLAMPTVHTDTLPGGVFKRLRDFEASPRRACLLASVFGLPKARPLEPAAERENPGRNLPSIMAPPPQRRRRGLVQRHRLSGSFVTAGAGGGTTTGAGAGGAAWGMIGDGVGDATGAAGAAGAS